MIWKIWKGACGKKNEGSNDTLFLLIYNVHVLSGVKKVCSPNCEPGLPTCDTHTYIRMWHTHIYTNLLPRFDSVLQRKCTNSRFLALQTLPIEPLKLRQEITQIRLAVFTNGRMDRHMDASRILYKIVQNSFRFSHNYLEFVYIVNTVTFQLKIIASNKK